MKVTEQSQSRMVLMGSPFQQMAVGGLFIAGGLAIAIGFLRHGSPLGILICLPVAGIGIYQLVTARTLTVTADRSAGTVSIAWRSLLGAGSGTVGIDTIDRIAYREFISEYRDQHGEHRNRDATSSLVLTDGTAVLLDRERDSSRYSLSLPVSRDRSADKELAMFLGVSMVDNGIVVVSAAAQADRGEQVAQPTPVTPPVQAPSAAPAPAQAPSSARPWPGGAMGMPTEHPPWIQTPPPAPSR